jgi:sulfur carrier protein
MNAGTIEVNGVERPLAAALLAPLLVELGYGAAPPGIAVAVNGVVVPRREWSERAIGAGDRIEIVGAVQGG